MTGYGASNAPTAPKLMKIPGLTLAHAGAAPEKAPMGPKNSQAAPEAQNQQKYVLPEVSERLTP